MESTDAAGATRRAQDLRADLTARLDVETLLAEASAARQAAVLDADDIIAQAQQVSEQLLQDSRAEAHRLVAEARAEAAETLRVTRAAADAVRERAEAQVEEHRRRVRAEVTEQVTRDVVEQARAELAQMREQSVGMIGDLEASVQILGVSLETARTNVADMLARLDGLRAHTAESLHATGPPARPRLVDPGPAAPLDPATDPAADPVHGTADEEPEEAEDPPRTATEAYLRSAHIDFGDPPLPPLDDAAIAARYVRDAGHRPAGPRGLRLTDAAGAGGDPLDDLTDELDPELDPEPDPGGAEGDDPADVDDRVESGGAGARPLGWLFRSPS